jgi:periplasmic copper chaperone A
MSLFKTFNLLVITSLFTISAANADSSLKIENAWSPEAPPVAKVMAGYMKINNISNKDVKIKSAKTKLFKTVEIHLTQMKDGMMSMVKQENLTVKANNYIELKSGGLHMMLIGKLKPITKGMSIPVTLTLSTNEKINIILKVKIDNKPAMMHHQHH